nr:MobA/MobL family protein [uncultured Albidiferax sp.]
MSTFHCRIKSGKPGSATDHARYIARERKYSLEASESDLVEKWSGNLPGWAKNADQFWKTADKQERVNGAAYREWVIALPNELTPEQRKTLMTDIAKHLVGSKTYQAAIHDREASLGGVSQPHGHLMYSDRCCDGIQRPPEQYFGRYNAKRPELGGCKKDSGGKHASRRVESMACAAPSHLSRLCAQQSI